MALNLGSQSFFSDGVKTVVENEYILGYDQIFPIAVVPLTPSAVVGSVEQPLVAAFASPPVVLSAKAAVTASMPPAATLAGAALVRAAQGDPAAASSTIVVDFQGQRTVSELAAPGATIIRIQPWLGTKFDDKVSITPESGGAAVSFAELQTERLLVTFSSQVSPATLAAQGSVVIATPPSNLELLVNGTRAWFRSGPAVGSPFTAKIDVTDAVATAAATGQPVVLTLRAAAPAALTLAGTATLLSRYPVTFPEGATRTVDAASEGIYALTLPIASARADAAGAAGWQVRRVVLDVSAKLPATRVIPADGPPFSPDAELVLDPSHALVVALPVAGTSRLASLGGVRLPISVGPDGAELAGTLRADAAGTPGSPLPKGALGPVTLNPPDPATAATGPAWIDLALTSPHTLGTGERVWLELEVARGSVVWQLGVPPADPGSVAELRRRTPSGTYAPLSTIAGIGSYSAAIRVVGQERPNDPLPAVEMRVAGAGTSSVAGVPTQAGATMILGLDPPAVTAPVAGGVDFELPLELTISTAGSYAVSSAEIQYTTSGA